MSGLGPQHDNALHWTDYAFVWPSLVTSFDIVYPEYSFSIIISNSTSILLLVGESSRA